MVNVLDLEGELLLGIFTHLGSAMDKWRVLC